MKVDWRRIKDHYVRNYASCLITIQTGVYLSPHLAVAFKTNEGEWKTGNGEVCWFEPVYFSYINEYWKEVE